MGIQEKREPDGIFQPDIQFNESECRYEVTLPWMSGYIPMSSGYVMCMNWLSQLRTRLKNDPKLLEEYDTIIKEQDKMGIIKPVTDNKDQRTVHFLPHHAVIRQDKDITKVRVAFDASAKSAKDDPFLNECLEKGPNLVPHLR